MSPLREKFLTCKHPKPKGIANMTLWCPMCGSLLTLNRINADMVRISAERPEFATQEDV